MDVRAWRAGWGPGARPGLRRGPGLPGRIRDRLGLPEMSGHGPLAAALLTDSLGDGLFLPFGLVYFLKTTSLGLPVIGLSLSAAGFAAVAAVPASGQLVDRFTAAPVVVAGNLVSAVAFTGYLAVSRAWQLAGLAFLAAAGSRLFWTANLALVGDAFGATERTRWFAFQRTMRNAGFGLGGVAGAVAVAGGSPAGYRLLAAANAASFALAALLMLRWSRRHHGQRGNAARDSQRPGGHDSKRGNAGREGHRPGGHDGKRGNAGREGHRPGGHDGKRGNADREGQRPGGHGGYRAALADRRFLRLTAVNLLFVLAMTAPEVLLTVYLVRDLHRPAWLAGVLFSLSTVLVVACQTTISRAAGRLRPGAVLRLAAGGWMVSFLLLWVLEAIPAAAVVPGAVGAIVIFTGAEMLQGPVLNALVVAAAPTALRGRYLAVYQLSWALGRAAAPGALSWLLAIGPGWPWAALTATCCACALLLRGQRGLTL